MKIKLFSLKDILQINHAICHEVKQKSVCMNQGKIESALGAAFYPGDCPFYYGGISKVAGALCFFLIKAHAFIDRNKRTAAISATLFMELNGHDLIYSKNAKNKTTAFTDIIESTACSHTTKAQLIEWFDHHKKSAHD